MNTVLDPTLLFITDDEWINQQNRDLFLEHLLDNLKIIDEYNISYYYWSDCLESSVWNAPTTPPWRIDRDWANKLVPIIYSHFNKRKIVIDSEFRTQPPIGPTPPIACFSSKDAFNSSLGSLMHWLLVKNECVFFCLGIPNRDVVNLIYSCSCHSNSITPTLIRHPRDWKLHIDICNVMWPTSNFHNAHDCFKKAILLTMERELNSFGSAPQAFSFENNFLQSLSTETEFRGQILYAISKRLLMSQLEASSDAGLEDEPIKGQVGIRRFRVSGATRIHYKYSNNGQICFLKYYPAGCHDDGL